MVIQVMDKANGWMLFAIGRGLLVNHGIAMAMVPTVVMN